MRQWLKDGLVTAIKGEEAQQALPYIVEVGPTVVDGSKELGQRILFADHYAHGGGLAPMRVRTADYGQFCFVPVSEQRAELLYRDSEFAATTHCEERDALWGNWWPTVYYERGADRAREALTVRK